MRNYPFLLPVNTCLSLYIAQLEMLSLCFGPLLAIILFALLNEVITRNANLGSASSALRMESQRCQLLFLGAQGLSLLLCFHVLCLVLPHFQCDCCCSWPFCYSGILQSVLCFLECPGLLHRGWSAEILKISLCLS